MAPASILLLSGSVREGSVNTAVLRTAAELLPAGLSPVVFTGLGGLPHFNPDLDHDPLPPAVAQLRSAIADASALLFSTPEYAGTLPGALKNLLEWTVGGVEITGKPTGWINPSTGPTGARGTYETLRTVLEYTDALVVPEACVTATVNRAQIVDGLIADDGIRDRIHAALAALAGAVESG